MMEMVSRDNNIIFMSYVIGTYLLHRIKVFDANN